MTFNKDAFLAPTKIKGPFDIDGFGQVYVREVPSSEAMYVYECDQENKMEVSGRIIILSVCDQDGNPTFAKDDLQGLLAIPAMRILPLMNLANEHSGFGSDVEAIVGNSETTT